MEGTPKLENVTLKRITQCRILAPRKAIFYQT